MWCSTDLGGWVSHRGAVPRGTVLAVVDEAVILEAGHRLAAATPHACVILFGSHARGDAGPHSDLDFLVVEPIVEAGDEESVRWRRTLRGLGIAADILVVSEREPTSRAKRAWQRHPRRVVRGPRARGLILGGRRAYT